MQQTPPACPPSIQKCGVREYLEALIAHERALREQTATDTARALHIQAAEYERRLDNLNHEHDRLDKAQREFVSREVYSIRMTQLQEWQQEVDRELSETRGASTRQTAIVAVGFVVLNILIGLAIKFL